MELKMNTYTLTWRHESYFGKTLSRERFDSTNLLWNYRLPNDKVLQFMSLIVSPAFCITPFCSPCCRLINCGKLVARQATYQGF